MPEQLSQRDPHYRPPEASRVIGERKRIVDDLVRRLGPEADLEEVNRDLNRLGQRSISGHVFEKARQRVHGLTLPESAELNTGEGKVAPLPVEVVRVAPLPSSTQGEADWLASLVSFACAVEKVGGLERARRMLEALERVREGL